MLGMLLIMVVNQNTRRYNMAWVYAMYKGENLLSIGTAKEICEEMGISIQTFRFYRTKHYKKIVENSRLKNRRIVIRLGKDDQE